MRHPGEKKRKRLNTSLLRRILLIAGFFLLAASLISPIFIVRSIRSVTERYDAVERMDSTLFSLSVKAQRLYGRDFNRDARDQFLSTVEEWRADYNNLLSLYGTEPLPGNIRELWEFTEPYLRTLSVQLYSLEEDFSSYDDRSLSRNGFAILDDTLRHRLGEARYVYLRNLFHDLIFFSTEIVPQYSKSLRSALILLNQAKQSAIEKLIVPAYLLIASLLLFAIRGILERFLRQREEVENARERNRYLEEKVSKRTEELREKNRMLEEAKDLIVEREKMAALGHLVAGIAHEMNTPLGVALTAVSYIGETIGERDPEDEIIQMSGLAISNLNKVSNLLNRFKNLAISDEKEVHRYFDLMDHIRHYIVPSLQPALEKRGHTLVVKGPESLRIRGLFSDYSQIIAALVDNSSQHGYRGLDAGEIRIVVESNEGGVRLSVEDDGVGIAKDVGEKIYEPFITTGRSQGGIGLGLTLVYNIVNHKLGGNIGYKSTPGEGTVVTLYIPFS